MKPIKNMQDLDEFKYKLVIFTADFEDNAGERTLPALEYYGFISIKRTESQFSPPTCIYLLNEKGVTAPSAGSTLDASSLLAKNLKVRLPSADELNKIHDLISGDQAEFSGLKANQDTVLNMIRNQRAELENPGIQFSRL